MNKVKRVIITADDLGIDPQINKGIIETYTKGILTSTALLMNAPYTVEGIELAKNNPNLEVGIHLSIVEGLSLRKQESTITDSIRYFNDAICLTRNWKIFLKKYFLNQINYSELEEELELQILEFKKYFTDIPFINGTQHMHIMPKVWRIVSKLMQKYDIKAVRLPAFEKPNVLWLNARMPFLIPFQYLGNNARRKLKNTGIKFTNGTIGMQFSGKISDEILIRILNHLPDGTSEIVMHPGYKSENLINNLPWAYSDFNWELERDALLSNQVKEFIGDQNIQLIKFSEL
ncbi:MAG: ChbG/HpnK family deacetylase [Bacteroidales bacterium]|nr:ChbG/HpnK family deacetylase [Bacteroidales bacterium]